MNLPSTLDLACGSRTQQLLTQDPLKPISEESIRQHKEALSLPGYSSAVYTTAHPGSKPWPLLGNHLPGQRAAWRPGSPRNHVRCQLGHGCQLSMCLTQQCPGSMRQASPKAAQTANPPTPRQ